MHQKNSKANGVNWAKSFIAVGGMLTLMAVSFYSLVALSPVGFENYLKLQGEGNSARVAGVSNQREESTLSFRNLLESSTLIYDFSSSAQSARLEVAGAQNMSSGVTDLKLIAINNPTYDEVVIDMGFNLRNPNHSVLFDVEGAGELKQNGSGNYQLFVPAESTAYITAKFGATSSNALSTLWQDIRFTLTLTARDLAGSLSK